MNCDQCFYLVKFHGQSGPYSSVVSEPVSVSAGADMLKDLSVSIKSIDAQVLVVASASSGPLTE
ncbi:hypothetical protein D3C79_1031460 [compost metagenome]